jgi:threonine/homoserine/homoserine lactone efflux protein
MTLLIGVVAAFVLGNKAASHTSTPKKWVSIVTILAGGVLLMYGIRLLFRPANPDQTARLTERMNKVASAPALAIIAAGAVLANPGIFMLVAAKSISQLDPSTAQYLLDWVLFTVVALLPLGIALLMLRVAPRFTQPRLIFARGWIERHLSSIHPSGC